MKCIVIDDEPIAHTIIEDYIANIEGLELIKSFYNAVDAITFVNTNPVDLIFLDINMPKLQGLDFVKTLHKPPAIVITSAYAEFALESFELPINDYLLKPFTFQRFLKAYTKVLSFRSGVHKQEVYEPTSNTIFLKGDKEIHQVKYTNIVYLESYGGYVKVFLQNESYLLIHQTLQYFETNLPTHFIRIHRSFIVNKDFIKSISGNRIILKNKKLAIGLKYKDNVNFLIKGS
ncbi:LytR/AlgR family response regulator transcription factor [Tenacibaculum amylolyticum]|uniref:LytR/AlgR family response regulator transcription factor n=1 Tax=Tenacibaculum amylolyticum TaxID=104269 RepID=UPI0038963071